MTFIILSTSLNKTSTSRLIAKQCENEFKHLNKSVELIDLNTISIPFCDAGSAYGNKTVQEISEKIRLASGIILCSPVYNYDISAAAKNIIELTGKSWTKKVVGIAVAAGAYGSLLSPYQITTSLMMDFRCVIVPKQVYVTGDAITNNAITNNDVIERISELTKTVVYFSEQLKDY